MSIFLIPTKNFNELYSDSIKNLIDKKFNENKLIFNSKTREQEFDFKFEWFVLDIKFQLNNESIPDFGLLLERTDYVSEFSYSFLEQEIRYLNEKLDFLNKEYEFFASEEEYEDSIHNVNLQKQQYKEILDININAGFLILTKYNTLYNPILIFLKEYFGCYYFDWNYFPYFEYPENSLPEEYREIYIEPAKLIL